MRRFTRGRSLVRDAGHAMRAAVGEVEREFVDARGKKELKNLLELLTDLNVVLGTQP